MDFALTPEQQSFRDEVRAWLQANLPKDWMDQTHAGADVPRAEAYDFLRAWQRKLYDAGLVGVTWPKEYGGRGLTFMEELILQEEMAVHKAPSVLNILAIGMAGPTIIAYGTEEQKRRYPPRMLSAEEIWCQGYSEPNAGSDLALRDPDEYAPFNTGFIVYHDDVGDYSTNEPIMDGTANLSYLLAAMAGPALASRK